MFWILWNDPPPTRGAKPPIDDEGDRLDDGMELTLRQIRGLPVTLVCPVWETC